jgi:hypothetical protein
MKILCLLLFLVVFLPLSAWAENFWIASPDHPSIWYNRSGDKISQELIWNASRNELLAEVAYNELEYLSLRDQLHYDTFKLSFPTIHLNEATGRLYFVDRRKHRHDIGSVKNSSPGAKVTLDPEVHFSVYRRDGVVNAVIISGPLVPH